MTVIATQQTLSSKAKRLAKIVSFLNAVRWMLTGAVVLAIVEQGRRGAFTTDDIVALMILWLIVYFAEVSTRRRLLDLPKGDANA